MCIFCEARDGSDDAGRLVLRRRPHAFLILNAYPYASGHVMVALNRHVARVEDATADELADAMALVQEATRALRAEYRADGLNVGINQGRVAGAGIEDHLHVHVVPRWGGDNNFMAVVGETRVLPEALDTTYARLRKSLDR
ncbi:MAG TPA: HIT domain-containing protein [Methylomirabilota bacterium]